MADRTEFWWNERKPAQPVLWESKIRLSEDFFNEIITAPGAARPEHPHGAQALALGLDLYLWLVYRTFTLRAPQRTSPGGRCTVSSARIRTTPALTMPSATSARASSAS